MIRKLNWQAFTAQERNKAIDTLKSIIASSGYIVNSNLFSNIALSLTIEIEEHEILKLHSRIKELMTLSELEIDTFDPNSNDEWWIFLNVTFS